MKLLTCVWQLAGECSDEGDVKTYELYPISQLKEMLIF